MLTTARPRSWTRCCNSPGLSVLVLQHLIVSWTRATSRESAALLSCRKTLPSTGTTTVSTLWTRRAMPTSAVRLNVSCQWSTACCYSLMRSRVRCRKHVSSLRRRLRRDWCPLLWLTRSIAKAPGLTGSSTRPLTCLTVLARLTSNSTSRSFMRLPSRAMPVTKPVYEAATWIRYLRRS